MAEEEAVEDGAGKKKLPVIKILIIALAVMLLLAGAVGGTLFAVGFFDKKDAQAAEEQIKKLEEQATASKNPPKPPEPTKVAKQSPAMQRFESSYRELEKPLLSNIANSRKVMSVNVALMTFYDERVFNNVKKHEMALRAAALDVMRQVSEPEISAPDFRKDLAAKIRKEMNAVLEKYEDFGGIEEVYFTAFVVQ